MEEILISPDLAEKLGYYAMYGVIQHDGISEERFSDIEGWTFISKEEEGQKYGYLIHAIFHRCGDPQDKAWSATFDVQSDNEIFIGKTFKLHSRKKVVKTIEVITWK